jgi:hypothetical protein
MEVVAALVGLVLAVMVPSVLVALARGRTGPSASESEGGA